MRFVIRNAELFNSELAGRHLADVVVSDGKVSQVLPNGAVATSAAPADILPTGAAPADILPTGAAPADTASLNTSFDLEIDAGGAALIPGLHDHHIHLLALAESLTSVKVGPPDVANCEQFRQAIGNAVASGDGWIRAVGYHESVAGELGRLELDGMVSGRPIRVQHSSGAMWMFNSRAMELLGLSADTAGAELDTLGEPTGRFFRSDSLVRLQDLEQSNAAGQLFRVGELLAGYGVTGVTDATPGYGAREAEFFSQAKVEGALSHSGALPQRLQLMVPEAVGGVAAGPHKIILSEHSLPSFEQLAQEISSIHQAAGAHQTSGAPQTAGASQAKRPVAVHCVSRASLALLLAVLDEVGSVPGDRVEHASVAPPELVDAMLRHRLRVVTQPNFVAERGDRYLSEVETDDQKWLYRCRGLLRAGLRVAGSTDAPFGGLNPWRSIWAAVERKTQPGGVVLGKTERLSPEQALCLFLSELADPGGPPRSVAPGVVADLCLLSAPWSEIADAMPENPVGAVWIGGAGVGGAGAGGERVGGAGVGGTQVGGAGVGGTQVRGARVG